MQVNTGTEGTKINYLLHKEVHNMKFAKEWKMHAETHKAKLVMQ